MTTAEMVAQLREIAKALGVNEDLKATAFFYFCVADRLEALESALEAAETLL